MYILGRTNGQWKIDKGAGRSCAGIGGSGSKNSQAICEARTFTSQLISIVCARKRRRPIGKAADSRLSILHGRGENCANPRGLSAAIFAARIHRQVTRALNSASSRGSTTRNLTCRAPSKFEESIQQRWKSFGRC